MRFILILIAALFILGAAASKSEHRGKLNIQIEDSSADHHYRYQLYTDNEVLELVMPKGHERNPGKFKTGDELKVNGYRKGNKVEIEGDNDIDYTQMKIDGGLSLPFTFGRKRALAFIVTFTGGGPITSAQEIKNDFATYDAFYREASLGKTWYQSALNPNELLDTVEVTVPSVSGCDTGTLAQQANAAANAKGFTDLTPKSYDHLIYYAGLGGCGWSGLADIGFTTFRTPRIFIVGDIHNCRVLCHEMGHNYGLGHAHSEGCQPDGCGFSEYGNFTSIMGNTSGIFNEYERDRLQFVNSVGMPPLLKVTAPGDYTFDCLDTSSMTATKGLKIRRGTTTPITYYYIGCRKGNGFSAGKPTGVVVHRGNDSSGQSDNILLWAGANGFLDSTHSLGDSGNNIYVSWVANTTTGATVRVDIPATIAAPSLLTVQ